MWASAFVDLVIFQHLDVSEGERSGGRKLDTNWSFSLHCQLDSAQHVNEVGPIGICCDTSMFSTVLILNVKPSA